jgi:hypothetical protein
MIIAVDGPAASGKGTIARALATHYGLPHLDTGLLYRAVGLTLLRAGGDPESEADAAAATTFPDSVLADPELRTEATGALASRVSAHAAVRAALMARQRAFAHRRGYPAGDRSLTVETSPAIGWRRPVGGAFHESTEALKAASSMASTVHRVACNRKRTLWPLRHRRRPQERRPRGPARDSRCPMPQCPAEGRHQGRRRSRGLCRPRRKRAWRSRAVARPRPPRSRWDKLEGEFKPKKRRTASSSAASRAASPSTSAAPWRSCRAARSTSARARRRPADGHSAAVPDPEDGPPPRQHRRVAPRRARREPRRAAHGAGRRTSKEGQILDGVVKNITDYGAFVDLGGIDGLLHVTDIAGARQPPERSAQHRPDGEGADHPHQPGHPAHLARHEAA